jgi:predicted dehydrogenase
MYLHAISQTYADACQLAALCDLSQVRMDWHNSRLATVEGRAPVPTYKAEQFDEMIAETRPDTVIVTTMDSTHHLYIARAMALGCDVITEKPMTTDAGKLRAIFEAIEQTGRELRVAFNYRYAPAHTRFRQLIAEGAIGRPLAVDLSWMLDTRHGADYFRRWHREKENSGGLLVHKATHHFDLVNWWVGAYPIEVFALGALSFYGRENALARGEHYSYTRYTGVPEAQNDPFGLFMDAKPNLRGLYLEAEAETGYVRDRNVFGEPITIEDTMTVSARLSNGVLMSYCLVAYSPWEGLRVAVTGTKGRIEMDVEERIQLADHDQRASTGPFRRARLRTFPMFGQGQEVELPLGEGGHGGADPVMLEQIFSTTAPPDPLHRAASHLDGAASVLVGIAANQSMSSGQAVRIDDLFPLSSLMKAASRLGRERVHPNVEGEHNQHGKE